jgi:RNA polymerase sigma factor (sigma-70 family)
MSAPTDEAGTPDAQLVADVLAGDREAFATVYDRYGDRLYDFAHSMLRQREEAEDAVADSFVIVAERLGQLRDPDRLRPWLYAIVRSECLRRLKARKRVAYGGEEQLVEMADDAMSPEAEAETSALRDLVWDASAGLAERDRAMLDLHLRQGLEGAELGEAMGVSASNAYVMLNRMRGQVERSLGALLIARLGRDDCDELDGILVDWDGRFSPLIRKRVARHVDSCDTCEARRRRIVSPLALLAGVPAIAAPLSLRDRVVNDTRLVAYAEPTSSFWGRRRNQAAAAGAAAIVVAGTVLLWPGEADNSGSTPSNSSEQVASTPEPTPTDTPSPTPTDHLLAGTLTLSTRVIDLGREGTSAPVRLTNTGDAPRTYRVSTATPWLTVSPASGSIAPGGSTNVVVSAHRSTVAEGRATGSVSVSWDGGTAPVTVMLTQGGPPSVGRPSVGASACGSTGRTVKVTVAASDASGLDTVVLRWTGPAGRGSSTMSGSGSTWSSVMGPFAVGGNVTLSATATDTHGRTTTGPSTTTNVDPCPQ